MIRTLILWLVGILVLVAAGAAYLYYNQMLAPSVPTTPPDTVPVAQPDNSVVAGPIVALTATSVTVQKQDGTTATLSIDATTTILLAGVGGQPGTPKTAKDISVGTMVLVTPSVADASVAQSIIIISAPPTQ